MHISDLSIDSWVLVVGLLAMVAIATVWFGGAALLKAGPHGVYMQTGSNRRNKLRKTDAIGEAGNAKPATSLEDRDA